MKGLICFALLIAASTSFAQQGIFSVQTLRERASYYEHGQGVERDFQKAYDLYCMAAALGDAEAAYNLGWMYFNGRGVERSLELAAGWFKRAAAKGDVYASNMLKRYRSIKPQPDSACPVAEKHAKVSREQIEGWVHMIAAGFQIDPELVLAVIDTESAFNPLALSPKNAMGLMQLMPETAKRFGVSNAWNPIQNILGGIAYLHWLLRYFQGNVKWVLAAYNAGEAAVERFKGIPPFAETRHYVRRILTTYPKASHPIPPPLAL